MVPTETPPPLPEETEPVEILGLVSERLERLNIPYLVVGSFASSLHGVVRYTQDADLIVDLKREQVGPFLGEFAQDFYCDRGLIEQALQSHSSFNIIHNRSLFKVDLFPAGPNRFKREELSRRRRLPLDVAGKIQPFVQTPEDAVLSKLEWYKMGGEVSQNQWRYVLGILKSQTEQLEEGYLRKWAAELGVADLLQRAKQEAVTRGISSR